MADEIELLRQFIDEIPGPSTDAWARARAAVAAARAEEEPARRRPGRWLARRRMLPVAAGVAAAVTGVLVAVFPAASGGTGDNGQFQETAYLVNRVQEELSRSGQHNLVGYTRTVFPPGTAIEPVGINGWTPKPPTSGVPSPRPRLTADVMVMWQYQDSAADIASTATGQPVYAEQSTGTARSQTVTGVSYRDATWWRATQPLTPAPPVPAPGCSQQGFPGGSSGWPAYIRQELSCGVYHLDGRQRVDGIDAVELTAENKAGRLVLWINPATYLPVRETQPAGPGPETQPAQTDFRWFPVTAAGLAHLKVRVPVSFRQVQPPSAR